jgi:DNA polymerase sigma
MSINQLNTLFMDFMQFYAHFFIFAISKINYARTLLDKTATHDKEPLERGAV